jgi:hypothetical protein
MNDVKGYERGLGVLGAYGRWKIRLLLPLCLSLSPIQLFLKET